MVSEIRTSYRAPESPAGIGEADGFAPPKRPLKIAAAMAMGMSCKAKGLKLRGNEAPERVERSISR